MYERGIFIFRRDLRIYDNIGLWEAMRRCKTVFPIFIFTPEQVSSANAYRSQNAVQFMIESLDDLDRSLRGEGAGLMTFYGDNVQVITSMIRNLKIDCIFFNKDYTPYSLERDRGIRELCEKTLIPCETFADYYLFEPGQFGKDGAGDPEIYKKFTPFYVKTLKNVKLIQSLF
jgi:deoxyribodipyrimidine photo-lyase